MKQILITGLIAFLFSCNTEPKSENQEEKYWRLKEQLGQYRWEQDSLLKIKYPRNGPMVEDDSLLTKIVRLGVKIDRIDDTLKMMKHINQK